MAFQFVVLATVLAAANAGFIPSAPLGYAAHTYAAPAVAHAAPLAYAAPVAKAVVAKAVDADFDPNPQYSYAYDVNDGITGDNKQHQETRNGDVVEGSYSFVEADGTRRTVHYTADPVNGFNAVVNKEPAVAFKTEAKVVAPAVAVKAAPAVALKAAPVAYASYAAPAIAKVAAPVAYTSYAAPAFAKFAAPAAYASYAAPAFAKFAAPAAYASYAAPAIAKVAAPISYAAPAYYH